MSILYAIHYHDQYGQIVYKQQASKEVAISNAIIASKRVVGDVYALAQQDGYQLGEQLYVAGNLVKEEGRF
jgi:hypothetical protein